MAAGFTRVQAGSAACGEVAQEAGAGGPAGPSELREAAADVVSADVAWLNGFGDEASIQADAVAQVEGALPSTHV